MPYKEIQATSVLNKIQRKDTLFNGMYTLDPYQNCSYACSYCDSAIDPTIYIKINAPNLLQKELKQIKKGIVILGSVYDPYQEAEETYHLTHELLSTLKEHDMPCHILTKSPLVLHDSDLLKTMKQPVVTISLTSLNKQITSLFEPIVASPYERLQTIQGLAEQNITAGLAIIPILPYITDCEFEEIIKLAVHHKSAYILHKYLELKGDQKRTYMTIIKQHFAHLENSYLQLYGDEFRPQHSYRKTVDAAIKYFCTKYAIPTKLGMDVSD
jgi:DNA repair photolyase